MEERERMIQGLFNRLNDLKHQQTYYKQKGDHIEALNLFGRINTIKNMLKKEMSL
jgi:hypothetical protein